MKIGRRFFSILGLILIIGLLFALVVMVYSAYNREVKFDARIWNSIEDFIYPEEKYGMAFWLINNGQLIGLSKDELNRRLCYKKINCLVEDLNTHIISVPLRNRKEHFGPFSYYDEHLFIIDAYMKIYLNNNRVVKLEISELEDGIWKVVK